jgi:predicted PurR-regulated permease PerM
VSEAVSAGHPADIRPGHGPPTPPTPPMAMPTPTHVPPPASTAPAPSPSPSQEEHLESGSVQRAPFLRPLLRVPLKKVFIWAAFLGLLFVLRPFLGLILLTFVLAYITSSIVGRIEHQFSSRRTPVLVVFAGIVGAVVILVTTALTRAIPEVRELSARLSQIEDPERFVALRVGEAVGTRPALEGLAAQQGGVLGAIYMAPARRAEATGALATLGGRLTDPVVADAVWERVQHLAGAERADGEQPALVTGARVVVGAIVGGVTTVLFALLFSFLIVWDRPKIAAGLAGLRESRLGDMWDEVAPSIATFGRLLGRGFEAQTVIALLNTAMTALGMWALGIKGLGFLSIVVFVCSFIPIAGVFISTVPMCVVALTMDKGGMGSVLSVVGMVTIVHIVEAYVLNPRIYGHHMRLHPLAVLVVLYLGEHLLGLWGLVIGVPLATYVWRHLVMGEAERLEEPSEAPVAPVTSLAPRSATALP